MANGYSVCSDCGRVETNNEKLASQRLRGGEKLKMVKIFVWLSNHIKAMLF